MGRATCRRLAWLLALLPLLPLLAGTAPAPQTLTPIESRPAVPDFTLVDMDGASHRLEAYRGRPVIINFWATWCPPCRDELPSMERAWNRLRDQGVMLLAINVGEDEATIFPFTADYPVTFPLLLDRDGTVVENWPVRGLPSTFVVDPRGRVAYQAIGGRAWDDPALLARVLELREE
jgi:peroxiredoxin